MRVLCIFLSLLLFCCKRKSSVDTSTEIITNSIVEENNSILTRFSPPLEFERSPVLPGSFGYFLRRLPLKDSSSSVSYFDQSIKENNNIYDAIVDLDIGDKDLHQCADAVIRLRAEYFWHKKNYNRIQFSLTNGMIVPYKKWMKGYRVKVEGNKTSWVKSGKSSNDYSSFWEYLEFIFTYAGTYSLSKELDSATLDDIKIGDVFIQGGFPGHAIIVVEMVQHKKTGEKMIMLAQSYMPAQEIQILKNMDSFLSPWYPVDKQMSSLITPEWNFEWSDLKRFK